MLWWLNLGLTKNSIPDVNIVETENAKLNVPLLVLGFAVPGLVGGIAVTHIIDFIIYFIS